MIKYVCPYTIIYYSKRYNKWITVPRGYNSDGATFATDIWTEGWFVHDYLVDTGVFDDGTVCTNIQASYVLYDILKRDKKWFRKYTWFIATLIFGELRRLKLSRKNIV